jgi:hypothetical protein
MEVIPPISEFVTASHAASVKSQRSREPQKAFGLAAAMIAKYNRSKIEDSNSLSS